MTRIVGIVAILALGFATCFAAGEDASDDAVLDQLIAEQSEALRLDPKNVEAYFQRGRIFESKEDYEHALDDFETVLWLEPQHVQAAADRKDVLFLQEFHRAMAAWKSVFNPTDADGYFMRSILSALKGDYDAALADIDKAIELDPKNTDGYKDRLALLYLKGDYAQAIVDLGKKIQRSPKDADAYQERAEIWAITGDYHRSLADLQEAIRLDADNPSRNNELAWTLATCPDAHVRNGQKAIELALKACNLDGWKEWHWHFQGTLAAAYAENGDFEQAVRWQEKANAIARDDKNLDEHEQREGRDHLALYKTGRSFRSDPKKQWNAEMEKYIGELKAEWKEFESMKAKYEKIEKGLRR